MKNRWRDMGITSRLTRSVTIQRLFKRCCRIAGRLQAPTRPDQGCLVGAGLFTGLEPLEPRVLLSASVTGWYSWTDHGPATGPALLEVPDDGSFSEPRGDGIARLEVHFNHAIDPSSFTTTSVQITGIDANNSPLDLSGVAITTSTQAADTVGVIEFGDALPDVARYLVRIVGVTDTNGEPVVGGTDRILTALKGDTSGDLRVSGVDLGRIWAQRTEPIDPSNAAQVRADVSQDGRVSGIDLARSWAQRNHDAQAIVDPVPITQTLADFLVGQMVPNDVFSTLWPGREGLLLNSVIPEGETGLVLPRSWVYDNAVSIIALTMAGRNTEAAQIIDALIQTAPSNGDLWFSVNVDNAGHADLVRTGANSWVGYAVNYHILARLTQNPNALNEDPTLQGYLTFSETIAQTVMSRQITDANDLRFGLVTGGVSTFLYEIVNGQLVEVFDPGERDWASTEHNIDAYFLLRDLAYITGNATYQQSADLIRNALVNGLYDTSIGQFHRGVSPSGLDDHRALDTASWGSLFLLAAGEPALAMTALETTDQYRNISNGVLGYKPSIIDRIYESDVLQQHVFPNDPNKSWDDISYVWSEGSLGVAMAYLRTGQAEKAQEILASMLGTKMNVAGKGGIRYTDQNLPFQFHDKPSTIGSAWAIMTQANLEGGLVPELFWAAQLNLPDGIIRLGQTASGQAAVTAGGRHAAWLWVETGPTAVQPATRQDGPGGAMTTPLLQVAQGPVPSVKPATATRPAEPVVAISPSKDDTTIRHRSGTGQTASRSAAGISLIIDTTVEDLVHLDTVDFQLTPLDQ